ncbi:TPA: LysE family translocator [Providencia stuartii]|uniref:LysE family translocator n=4 Tax=Gammaproteobacteria TaxID=1236 RepID=A0AAJ1JFS0_PROST|nr:MULTISPECIES: LysE family translocator [Providencia]SST02967.1 Transporter LysE family [Acinetobacter baumannii]AFH95655.1 LysE family transporter [Providencia stuartii MRSN 2154]AIN63298.1 lysE type translocator family protein [Providencia stuartii]AMG66238.1 LysE family translocator [Providencia stuartii]APG49664.1 lysine transporter LysE [Providencia stuartii]
MNIETFISLSMFSFVTSITPGPNNIMLLASGMNFGLKRTMPHALGVSIGFLVMLIAVGMGVGALIKSSEIVYNILKYLGIAYLLWLAWKTTISRSVGSAKNSNEKPLTLLEAALFQWVNPKAWMMAISGMALYTDSTNPYSSMLLVAVIFSLINFPSVTIWAMFGSELRERLKNPNVLKKFNLIMGLLLAASAISVIFQ